MRAGTGHITRCRGDQARGQGPAVEADLPKGPQRGDFAGIVHPVGEDTVGIYDVVGPICESGDVLGHDRLLPETREGDVLLIANAGAYARAMASSYNLREPPEELFV